MIIYKQMTDAYMSIPPPALPPSSIYHHYVNTPASGKPQTGRYVHAKATREEGPSADIHLFRK
jgi:hypothetical protein